MIRRFTWLSVLGALLLATPVVAENWPGWRGPRGDGSSHEQNLATQWNGATGENIAWKVPIPGEGHGSPVVYDDRVFLLTCLPESEERVLLCLDRLTGSTVWQRTVLRAPLETKHDLNSYASSTPATDGERIYVTFLEVDGSTIDAPNVGSPRPVTPGQVVLAAYDYDGNEVWHVRAGPFVSAHGFCSNPVLFEDLVIVNGDHDGDSYIVALERDSGRVRWRVKREHGIRSYVTPLIRTVDGRTQMVLSGSKSVVSYDPRSGARHWYLEGPTEQFVASMVFDGERFFLTAGFPDHHIMALRADGQGSIAEEQIAWRETKGAAYVPSPVIVGDYLLVVSDIGVLSCFDTASGTRHWMERIGPQFSTSAVAADGLAYFTSDRGETIIIRADKSFQKVGECRLGEDCSSSPAISHGGLFLRGHQHLFHIRGAQSESN